MPLVNFRRRPRPQLAVAVAVTAAITLASASASAETSRTATLSSTTPSAAAKSAGVRPGDAYLGWNSQTSAPQVSKPEIEPAASALQAEVQAKAGTVTGMDVSRWQGNVNWAYWKGKGKTFVYVKATEGTGYRNAYFSQQYTGSYKAGFIRGAYHYALPNRSSGYAQASYFVARGGSWSRDGRTLPGVVDMEYNPYGSVCYGMSRTQMVAWVKSFTRRYKALTGVDAVIYTNLDWWSRCTGNSGAFTKTNPLWVARYASKVGRLPGGWPFYTFWQHTTRPLDQNRFSASRSRLIALAKG